MTGVGRLHVMPVGAAAVRWHAHFGSPFLHPTVLFDRELLERHELRYDERFAESEDYDLWARLLDVGDGDNLEEPLVLYRVHPGAGDARGGGTCSARSSARWRCGRSPATAPGLGDARAELAWRVGAGEPVAPEEAEQAGGVPRAAYGASRPLHGASRARWAAARAALARAGALRGALALRPSLALDVAAAAGAAPPRRAARVEATEMLGARLGLAGGRRPACASPSSRRSRRRIARRCSTASPSGPEVDLTVLYAGRTVAGPHVGDRARASRRDARRRPVPGGAPAAAARVPGDTRRVPRAGEDTRPDVVVVSGWSTFASQAAVAWCRARRVPYVLLVESNDRDPRPAWRRAIKRLVVPPVVRGAEPGC